MAHAIRGLASAALATALHSGIASAQTPEPDAVEHKTKASEKTASDSTPATPTAKASPVKPSKQASEPFKPTERIGAESVVSFPENI
jgi:hypothetical protein